MSFHSFNTAAHLKRALALALMLALIAPVGLTSHASADTVENTNTATTATNGADTADTAPGSDAADDSESAHIATTTQSVETGDAEASGDVQTYSNTNSTDAKVEGGEASLEVENENQATTTSDTAVAGNTGAGAVTSQGGALVRTGNALATAQAINVVNTNITNSNGLVAFLTALFGDMSFDFRNLFDLFGGAASDSPCALTSCSSEFTDLSVRNDNDATIHNTLSVVATTGGNTARAGQGSASVSTGDAYAAANVVNVVNTNITNSNYLLLSVNNFGELMDDIVFPGAEFFADMFGEAALSAGSQVSVSNDNQATTTNMLSVDADTGDNSTEGNGGSITTGDAHASASVYNQLNRNIFGNSLNILVRVHGTWQGDVFGLPEGITWSDTGSGILLSFDPNAERGTGALAQAGERTAVANTNNAVINNNISVYALTGENRAEAEAGSASVSTGDAYAAANVVNIANTNVIGSNWLLAIFNIFGDWKGNLAFGRPDLWLGARAEVPATLEPGSCFTYHLTVTNFGDAAATNVLLRSIFNKTLQQLDVSGLSDMVRDDFAIHMGRVGARESRTIALPACIPAEVNDGVSIETDFVVSARETDANPTDNRDSIALVTAYESNSSGGYSGTDDARVYVSKEASKKSAMASSTVDYTVRIKNLGGPSYHSMLVDTIYDEQGKSIHEQRWALDTIESGEEIIVTYSVFFSASTTPGIYTNEAFVSGVDRNPDYNNERSDTIASKGDSASVQVTAYVPPATSSQPEAPRTCTPLLRTYIRFGAVNEEDEVRKLQEFLNEHEQAGLAQTGKYDEATRAAVYRFQETYRSDILLPWGITGGTGHIYYTTQKKINELYCEGERAFPLSKTQEREIAEFRARLEDIERSGGVLGEDELLRVGMKEKEEDASMLAQNSQAANNEKTAPAPTQYQSTLAAVAESGSRFFGDVKHLLGGLRQWVLSQVERVDATSR